MGDPAGVGPTLCWDVWESRRASARSFYVVAIPDVMARASRGRPTALISEPREACSAFSDSLPILPIDGASVTPGWPDVAAVPAIAAAIRIGVEHAKAGHAAGVVTSPIAKSLMYRGGFRHAGHTEYLAELGGISRPVMMLVGGGLRVALATIHTPLARVPTVLSTDLIVDVGRITAAALRRDFGLKAPRIGLCGLNPHAGEDGAIGREEIDVINPAAAILRAEGVDISDARPGDTIFHEHRGGQFDAVIAMYHDQGLIPVKTLDLWGGVNVTLGLPFIRTSPDHGTAYDAAAAGTARPDSMLAAFDLADAMARARENT